MTRWRPTLRPFELRVREEDADAGEVLVTVLHRFGVNVELRVGDVRGDHELALGEAELVRGDGSGVGHSIVLHGDAGGGVDTDFAGPSGILRDDIGLRTTAADWLPLIAPSPRSRLGWLLPAGASAALSAGGTAAATWRRRRALAGTEVGDWKRRIDDFVRVTPVVMETMFFFLHLGPGLGHDAFRRASDELINPTIVRWNEVVPALCDHRSTMLMRLAAARVEQSLLEDVGHLTESLWEVTERSLRLKLNVLIKAIARCWQDEACDVDAFFAWGRGQFAEMHAPVREKLRQRRDDVSDFYQSLGAEPLPAEPLLDDLADGEVASASQLRAAFEANGLVWAYEA